MAFCVAAMAVIMDMGLRTGSSSLMALQDFYTTIKQIGHRSILLKARLCHLSWFSFPKIAQPENITVVSSQGHSI